MLPNASSSLKLVLAKDVEIIDVDDLSAELKIKLGAGPGDYALSRASGRQGAKLINKDLCDFLQLFRKPHGIADAVLSFASQTRISAEDLLEEVFPLLQNLVHSSYLVRESDLQTSLSPHLSPRKTFGDLQVLRAIQLMDDTQVYCARQPDGRFVALKLASLSSRTTAKSLATEANMLSHLEGRSVPAVVAQGSLDDQAYLATEWIEGIPADRWADSLRAKEPDSASAALIGSCAKLLSVFGNFHQLGVVHGDIHPGNILVTRTGEIRVLDFGLSRKSAGQHESQRGGIGFYFDPEFASARLNKRRPPRATPAGEQYALGALLYRVLAGQYYLPFSFERDEAFRQIVEDAPRSFNEVDAEPWPEVEAILHRMLSKSPEARYPSLFEAEAAIRELRPQRSAVRSPMDAAVDIDIFLDAQLAQIQQQGFGVEILQKPRISVAMGLTGRAYGLYRIALARRDSRLLELADQLAERAYAERQDAAAFFVAEDGMDEEMLSPLSVLYAEPGISAVRAIIAHSRGDAFSLNAMMAEFVRVTNGIETGKLDFAFGMPGVLSICADLLRMAACHNFVDATCIRELGLSVESVMRERFLEQSTLQAGGIGLSGFLGAAHGWVGNLYAMLKWWGATSQQPAPAIAGLLDALANLAQPFGRGLRWPRKLPSESPEFLGSWCNGTAGFVHLWCEAHRAFGDTKYQELAEAAAWSTWDSTEPGIDLCCGSAGRAYALLAYGHFSGDKQWVQRATVLTRLAIQQAPRVPFMREIGLYKGPIGLLALCSELRSDSASMPFFALEP